MNWVRPAEVVVAVGVLTTFTDWIIAGDWLQKTFGDPEIWRAKVGFFPVLVATAMPFVTCAGFTLLAYKFDLLGLRSCIKLAAAIWVIGPFPMITSNTIFLSRNRAFAVLHAVSWLVKLMIIAVAVGKFVH